ncbi:hypothetical protein ACFPDQ_04415 [Pseudofrancisella aestuarii]|uniref:4-O-methyl-glucuronoyl methylesterase-like domain-containing protein n=1 Tax=Pseudofrancisella aestuarii TaxID=2670347 RepID=A0ABV9TB40_9GAMM|nr:acetylxylan esterase [Pseudofrancisella aestuarii]
MLNRTKTYFLILTSLFCFNNLYAIGDINYDESKVPEYKLIDPLTMENGEKVTDIKKWQQRRLEIIQLFKDNVYGNLPNDNVSISYKVTQKDDNALNGKAIEQQAEVTIGKTKIYLLMYFPKEGKENYPVFLGYNFCGNQSITKDSKVLINPNWANSSICQKPDDLAGAVVDDKFTEKSRGTRAYRYSLGDIIDNGYGFVTAYYGDVAPDSPDKVYDNVSSSIKDPKQYSAISLWSWGLIEISKALKDEPLVNQKEILVYGFSRLGKAALWAGALDQNFAMVISVDSGMGGASLTKREYGETTYSINTEFPHWFSDNFKKYNSNPQALPLDQHMLLSLIAPRPLYVASANDDQWADPKGEFLSAKATTPVYALFGEKVTLPAEQPKVDDPKIGIVSYHIRSGGHNLLPYDWTQFIKAANLNIKK